MKRKKPKILSFLSEASFTDYLNEEVIENQLFEKQEIPRFLLSPVTMDGCFFHSVSFSSCDTTFSFYDCIFENCEISNVFSLNATFIRCEFRQCKFSGWNLDHCSLEDILFENCIFRYTTFSSSVFKNVAFHSCQMEEIRFFELKLKDIEFDSCSILQMENIATPLKDIDLSSCTIMGGAFHPNDLKGLIVNEEQALSFATLLGLRIHEEKNSSSR